MTLFTLNRSKANLDKITAGFTISVSGINSLMQALKDLGDEGYSLAKNVSGETSRKLHRFVMIEAERAFKDSGQVNYKKERQDGSHTAGKQGWNHPPGNLRRSIKAKKPRQNKRKAQIYATIGFSKGAAYGVPVEYGHEKVLWGKRTDERVEARSFLRVAFDKHKQALFADMLNQLWAGISRIWSYKKEAA